MNKSLQLDLILENNMEASSGYGTVYIITIGTSLDLLNMIYVIFNLFQEDSNSTITYIFAIVFGIMYHNITSSIPYFLTFTNNIGYKFRSLAIKTENAIQNKSLEELRLCRKIHSHMR